MLMKIKRREWILGSTLLSLATLLTGCMCYQPAPSGALTIFTQPRSQRVPPGSDVDFTVSATGTPPFRYFWRINGVEFKGHSGSLRNVGKINLHLPKVRFRDG